MDGAMDKRGCLALGQPGAGPEHVGEDAFVLLHLRRGFLQQLAGQGAVGLECFLMEQEGAAGIGEPALPGEEDVAGGRGDEADIVSDEDNVVVGVGPVHGGDHRLGIVDDATGGADGDVDLGGAEADKLVDVGGEEAGRGSR